MTSTNDIRRSFLEYFGSNGHEAVPSAPLVPYNDPTLMFVNAGMVPFKNVFTGLEKRNYSRATSAQKCVRAGGKHNDLDNVGYTARHHTFFEMLGNFSFGDYFKEQAIFHAWELLTKVWKVPEDKLLVTVYHTDDEAYALWQKIAGLPDERIIRIATSDNFWAMGDNGPCGPSSEIFYDHGDHIWGGPPGSPEEDGDRFIEIWNLVFMQHEQENAEIVRDLPHPSIDTGMGLERIAALMQGQHDNYDIDLFKNLISASEDLTGTKAEGDQRASHRVIADHLRSTSFLIADGVLPANEGRGYVLRRIMRRAMRHAHLLGSADPLMHRLVPALINEMGAAYPDLARARPLIVETLEREETRFRQTLDKGLKLLEDATRGLKKGDVLPGQTAFKLYDTFGFPYDLTEDALRAEGIGVDGAGFAEAMAEQKAAARAAWKGSGDAGDAALWYDIAEREGATEFTGYSSHEGEATIVALLRDGAEVESAKAGETVGIITNQTPFYGESGGQSGDSGRISLGAENIALVADTSKPLGRLHVHQAKIERGEFKVGDTVALAIDTERRSAVRANHSATHLLHAALRNRLGGHVTQKGSMVAAERLRFDFSHPKPLSDDDIAVIEAEVNAQIRANSEVTTRLMTPDDAVEAGALALFGEKYGDEVRVLSMGQGDSDSGKHYSVELCGGTHVSALGDIGLLRIVAEGAVSSGIRRIEALTGEGARVYLTERDGALKAIAALLKTNPDDVSGRVTQLLDERKRLERELTEAKKSLALSGGGAAGSGSGQQVEKIGNISFIGQVLDGVEAKALRGLIDEMKKKVSSGVIALIAVNDGRASISVGVTDDLTGAHDAVALLRLGVEKLGGKGGGGRADMAQGGGPDAGAAKDAIAAIKSAVSD